ncbi:MAG: septal ring factor EnvC (AmiA/AmiB activator) [Psychrobacter glaciei]|jgi:septal ring factor EnvC (AmiA/AmiB activator)
MIKYLLLTLSVIALLVSFSSPALSANADEGTVSKKQLSDAHLKKLRDDINELQNFLKKAQDDHKDLVDSLRKSDEEVAKISKLVEGIKQSLQEERARLKKLKGEQKSLNLSKNDQQKTLKNIIIATYKLGQEPQLKLLLNQQDPSKLARNLSYLQYFNLAHQEQIKQYRSTLNKLDEVTDKVAEKQKSLQDKLSELRSSRNQLKSLQLVQQKNADALDNQIKDDNQRLSRLQQDRQNLMSLLGQVEQVFMPYERNKESRPFKQLKGKLPNPIKVKPKRMFGMVQSNGKQQWEGWLYPSTEGSDIHAVHHGRIVFSDWLRGFGLLTIVDHGQGYMSLYARNQSLLTSVGDWVEAGDVIAKLGRSGGYDQSALYFEIRHKGEPQNPKRWLAKR